jgi:dolichol-phosphate mannosyltransferase
MISTDSQLTLAVVIPMYNEERGAARCVRAVCDVLAALPGTRLIAVNDGSSDGTEAVLREFVDKESQFRLVSYAGNRGYGGAVQAGFSAARAAGFEFALLMDSDLTNDPKLIPSFSAKLAEGRYDVVKASRYIPGGGMEGVPSYRQRYTIVGNRIAAALFRMGIRDCTNAFHAVRLRLIDDLEFKERGFSIVLEELLALKKRGARATEIPYILTSRAAGEGQSKFTYSPRVLWSYLKYALLAALVIRPRSTMDSI